jgi:hypothetical protein
MMDYQAIEKRRPSKEERDAKKEQARILAGAIDELRGLGHGFGRCRTAHHPKMRGIGRPVERENLALPTNLKFAATQLSRSC